MAKGKFLRERQDALTALQDSLRTTAPEQWAAWSGIVLIHLLVLWAVTQPEPVNDDAGPSMQLVFIQLPPPVVNTMKPATDRGAVPTATASRPQAMRIVPSTSPTAQAPAEIPQMAADDQWNLAAGRSAKDDGILFDRTDVTRSINPIRMGPPERFRMRGNPSLADIVRAVSQALFWPAGYTDDPCPGLKKAVDMFSAPSSEREQGLLEDAVLLESRYCR